MSLKNSIKKILIISVFLIPSLSLNAATNFLVSPDLKLGDTNTFVSKLQKVLNTNGFVVNKALGQAGSLNNETNTFGLLTEKALSNFQLKYNITPAIGYFGVKSKTKLNELLNSGKFVEAASISSGKPIGYGPDTSSANTTGCTPGYARALTTRSPNDTTTGYVTGSITWTFSACVRYGTFVNGEYWVIGPVTVSNIDPNTSQSTYNVQHGSMINPIPGATRSQGFDSNPETAAGVYNATLNASLRLPLQLNAGDVLVSARSQTYYPTYLKTIAALTVLNTPPPSGSFRPSIFGTDRTVKWNVSQLEWSVLKNLPAPSLTPSRAWVADQMPALPWFEWTSHSAGDETQAEDNTHDGPLYQGHWRIYGRDIGNKFGTVALWLNTDQSQADKEAIAIQMVQNGIDIYEYVKNGGGFIDDGGIKMGRKLPLVIAAMMLNDTSLKAMAGNPTIFQEDRQLWIVNQSDVGRVVWDPVLLGLCYPDKPILEQNAWCGREFLTYRQQDVGTPEWGIRHSWLPSEDNRSWGATYRDVNINGMRSPWLAAYLMGAQSLWNHPAAFAYMERVGSGGGNNFYTQMWNAYKTNIPVTDAILNVSKTGVGTVTSGTAGINCGSDCSETYTIANNTSVTLTATPPANATVTWSGGGCSGNGLTCGPLLMTSSRNVGVTFAAPVLPFGVGNRVEVTATAGEIRVRNNTVISDETLRGTQDNGEGGVITGGPVIAGGVTWWTINYDGPGTPATGVVNWDGDGWSGQDNLTVTSIGTPGEFTLATQTSGTGTGTFSGNRSTYNNGEIATVTAIPSEGSSFSGWSGDCAGTGVCTLTMNGNKSITATFTLNPVNTYSISTSVVGSGTIGGSTGPYNSGSTATLTATPSEGFVFSGWSGDCTNTSGNCLLFMDRNKSVTATFTGMSVQSPSINSITPDTKTITKGKTYTIAVNYSTPVERDIVLELKKGDPVIYTDKRITVLPGINKTVSVEITVPQSVLVGEELNYLAFMAPVNGKWNSRVSYLQEYGIYASNGSSDDEDNDGVLNADDKCPNTPTNMKAHVNIHGCPKPLATNIKLLNNATTTDLTNVIDLEVEDKNATFGKIKFNQPINVFGTTDKKSQINLDSYIQIQNKKVIVDSINAPQFNKPATITLYNVNLTKPLIKKDGEVYATSSSPIMTYNPTTKILTFTVTGFSTYDIAEEEVSSKSYLREKLEQLFKFIQNLFEKIF